MATDDTRDWRGHCPKCGGYPEGDHVCRPSCESCNGEGVTYNGEDTCPRCGGTGVEVPR